MTSSGGAVSAKAVKPRRSTNTVGAAGDDELGELRREEALEPSEPLELRDLRLDALLEIAVEVGEFGRLRLDRAVEILDPEQRAHSRDQLGHVDRLGEEIVRSRLEPLDTLAGGVERRHHDHGQDAVLRVGSDPPAHLVAVHAGHHDVEQHEIGPLRLYPLEPFLAGPRGRRRVALGGEQVHQHLHVVGRIVHDEDLLRRHALTLTAPAPGVKLASEERS